VGTALLPTRVCGANKQGLREKKSKLGVRGGCQDCAQAGGSCNTKDSRPTHTRSPHLTLARHSHPPQNLQLQGNVLNCYALYKTRMAAYSLNGLGQAKICILTLHIAAFIITDRFELYKFQLKS
jgi:hypothetical protein